VLSCVAFKFKLRRYITTTTHEDTPVTITLVGSDPEDGIQVGAVIGVPQFGTLSTYATAMGADQVVVYTPPPNFHGTDQFVYSVADAAGAASAAATVTITVGRCRWTLRNPS
jgi:hypothetical protein